MTVERPSKTELSELAADFGFKLKGTELDAYAGMVSEILEAYDVVDAIDDVVAPSPYSRDAGYVPAAEENWLGAWVRKLDIAGAPTGPLHGKQVAIKDTIAIAGVPLTAGTNFLAGTTPAADASVVARILDAGGTIAGVAACEYLTLSGSSHSSLPLPVHNPHRRHYSAGGSSSGCAALVAANEADLAIGTDQGGSVRIPASWCGIVGLKPTYGLIPYTGIMPIEWTMDHAGPMSRTVADNALFLSVLAGPDGIDERQAGSQPGAFGSRIGQAIAGVRIGMLKEGFETPVAEVETNELVRRAADHLKSAGAIIEEVSLPLHRDARSIWTPAFVEGLLDTVLMHNGAGNNQRSRYYFGVTRSFARWRENAGEFSVSVKAVAMAARFMRDREAGVFYGKSQNLIRNVRTGYDRLFARHDLLLMPTTPYRAVPLPPADADPMTLWHASLGMNVNTAPFCATGHPAISIPCGAADGLPVGAMLVGQMWREDLIYQVGRILEDHWQ